MRARLIGRWTELYLLCLTELFLCFGLLSQARYSRAGDSTWFILALEFGSVFLVAHLALLLLVPESDQLLLPIVSMLSAFGIVFVGRLQPDLASRQLFWLALGVGLMVLTLGPLRFYARLRNYQYLAAFIGLSLMLGTALVGKEINGSRLWLGGGGFFFQVTAAQKRF